jgi:hypothetical protein
MRICLMSPTGDDWALSRDGDSFKGLGSWEGSHLFLMNEFFFFF